MTRPAALFAISALLAVAACGSEPDAPSNSAEDFAARINGGQADRTGGADPNGAPSVAPSVAQPLEGAAPGAFAPGTATDPQSAGCNANLMGPWIGREADDATRLAVEAAAVDASAVRFIPPGGAYIRPDPTSPRLNLMIDNLGIIRDARCG